ncbi:leucine aminopeptidase 1 [Xylariomycetidae sp. FL0641]|nr:leucine aminopeptidase 1 [Xylariomycetidae sp. FL0641]
MVRLALVAALAATVTALSIKHREATQQELFTIELAPGVTQLVTEEEKIALKMEGKGFIDITKHPRLASPPLSSSSVAKQFFAAPAAAAVAYPTAMTRTSAVAALIAQLDPGLMETRLANFSGIYTRYYKSATGRDASDWVRAQVQGIVDRSGAGAQGVTVETVDHDGFPQNSVIARIPGQTAAKVIVGAHLDSINGRNPAGRAPGADDDGSGTVTTMEAFRVLLGDAALAGGQARNTLEFHWYAGEEGGLLGSGDVFDAYAAAGQVVKAMLQQDMTGYREAGPMGVIGDNVDGPLTAFVRRVIDAYTTIGSVDSECGYGCSDHASARAAGYPSSFVLEAAFEKISPYIHSADDTLDTVSYEHMREHARLVLGFAYELAFADL